MSTQIRTWTRQTRARDLAVFVVRPVKATKKGYHRKPEKETKLGGIKLDA